MSPSDLAAGGVPVRREPPPFRRLRVQRVEALSPRMARIVLSGDELEGLEIDEPAASVRLLLPPPDGDRLVIPAWSGNQFVLPDGDRAPIRTFTPRRLDPSERELTLDIVVHEGGAASDWASSAAEGDEVAISGPGRGYEIDPTASDYLLVGDETALAAIAQLLEVFAPTTQVTVHVEIADPSARLELPPHPATTVAWHELGEGSAPGSTLVDVIAGLEEVPAGVWIAGEAASVQKIRKNLFDERGLARARATVRGYWKLGRAAT
ncbi:MAG: siderophore-interacting protein [Acidobacteria bacterium]|nr:siderophore-interacting protein [Acidobacteriota bacterium]